MSSDRRRTAADRRQAERVPAVFAVKKLVGPHMQLCQAEDISPGGMAIKRPAPGAVFHPAGFLLSIVGALLLLFVIQRAGIHF